MPSHRTRQRALSHVTQRESIELVYLLARHEKPCPTSNYKSQNRIGTKSDRRRILSVPAISANQSWGYARALKLGVLHRHQRYLKASRSHLHFLSTSGNNDRRNKPPLDILRLGVARPDPNYVQTKMSLWSIQTLFGAVYRSSGPLSWRGGNGTYFDLKLALQNSSCEKSRKRCEHRHSHILCVLPYAEHEPHLPCLSSSFFPLDVHVPYSLKDDLPTTVSSLSAGKKVSWPRHFSFSQGHKRAIT